jgi:hypothetical protein
MRSAVPEVGGMLITIGWVLLAAIHAAPAAVFFAPGLGARLYGPLPEGIVALLLLQHRAALFLAVLAVALLAAASPGARRAASLVVGISVVGFLWAYLAQGAPEGPLRRVAIIDALALLPLGLVTLAAWRS